MGITRITIKPGDEIPEDVKEQIRKAAEKPVVPDEECPEYSIEEMIEMAEKAREKRAREKKQVLALRVSPDTLEKARATGKGYTGFLSRLLDLAIKEPELVKKALELD